MSQSVLSLDGEYQLMVGWRIERFDNDLMARQSSKGLREAMLAG